MREADDEATTRLPNVPPEWVPFIVLASVLARRFEISEAAIAVELADAVWTGALRKAHRIADVEPDRLPLRQLPPGRLSKSDAFMLQSSNQGWLNRRLPHGLSVLSFFDLDPFDAPSWRDDAQAFGYRMIAEDWDRANVDRRNGTVRGWELQDGTAERLVIEVNWQAAKSWAGPRVKQWKMQEGTGALAIAPPRGGAARGGAPPHRGRDDFDREVVRRLTLDGGHLSMTQFRNEMKQWASDKMNPPPDDRTIERWISRLVLPGLLSD